MYISAEQGICEVKELYPTDNNKYIYGVAQNWTLTMECEHELESTYGLTITFPEGFYVKETSRCIVGLQNAGYSCIAKTATRLITIMGFTNSVISGGEEFSITFNSILNPGFEDMNDPVEVTTLGSTLGTIDIGSFTFDNDYF
jgi:hypothetical protein